MMEMLKKAQDQKEKVIEKKEEKKMNFNMEMIRQHMEEKKRRE